jgi:TonB dependent receptor
LVSVDAMEEFRIQTSTYAPEFGRTPGAQISIATRSGINQFHGTAFDYLRNSVLDANNWFNGFTNNPPLPKAKEIQNDFGGTFSGPIVKDRTFFFFSYEGLRLRLPQTTLTQVPDLSARQNASPTFQPFLNAFPFDPTQPDLGNGVAQFNSSYSNPASLDAYSIRIDHKLATNLELFGRYSYSPSKIAVRGGGGALSTVSPADITIQTATVGLSWAVSPTVVNDLRFNYSRTNAQSHAFMDGFGGAIPLKSLPLPTPFTAENASFNFDIFSLLDGSVDAGLGTKNLQRQVNLVDSLSMQKGSHSLKIGVDFRRLSPVYEPGQYFQQAGFDSVASASTGNLFFASLTSSKPSTLVLHNLGVFAQDTWRISPRVTLTYGLRWDVDFAPSSVNGPSLLAVTGYNPNNLSTLALAPPGTPPFKTSYGNVAPRIGMSYQASNNPEWQTVVRGGFGVFYDLVTSQVGNAFSTGGFPFGAANFLLGTALGGTSTFPLSPVDAAPPRITLASLSAGTSTLYAFDPHLRLPYTLEWNVAVEQALGRQETLSASYIGSVGRRLIQSASITSPPTFPFPSTVLVGNTATSDYNALQLQFQRRLSQGLQALASYTWSHSIDTGSEGSYQSPSNTLVPGENQNSNRGSSDFDIRSAFSAGITYEIPGPKINAMTDLILHGWSVQSFIVARSAPPENIFYTSLTFTPEINGATANIRPDVVPGQPLYLHGSQFPGGKAFNPNAFTPPPKGANGIPLRQGDLGRNALRAFGATQWDFAVHRDFAIHESLKLQFRAEMFNVLNHPNFGPPLAPIDQRNFGISNQILAQSLGGLVGTGSFDPLYQIGGPRSIQLALKLSF